MLASRHSAQKAYDVRVTYTGKLTIRIHRLVFDFNGLIGGRCRIRTCDFHRVKVALYR
jgi:hypothetical protein